MEMEIRNLLVTPGTFDILALVLGTFAIRSLSDLLR